jgi:hypothetical protein
VGFRQHICPNLLVGGYRIAFYDEEGGWSGGFHRNQVEADVDEIGKMSTILSGKMTSLDEAIELHEEP